MVKTLAYCQGAQKIKEFCFTLIVENYQVVPNFRILPTLS